MGVEDCRFEACPLAACHGDGSAEQGVSPAVMVVNWLLPALHHQHLTFLYN